MFYFRYFWEGSEIHEKAEYIFKVFCESGDYRG